MVPPQPLPPLPDHFVWCGMIPAAGDTRSSEEKPDPARKHTLGCIVPAQDGREDHKQPSRL